MEIKFFNEYILMQSFRQIDDEFIVVEKMLKKCIGPLKFLKLFIIDVFFFSKTFFNSFFNKYAPSLVSGI